MVKRKENLLAAGILCMVIAILFNVLGNSHLILNLLIFLFLGLTIFFNAEYLVFTSLNKKKKK